MTLSVRWIKEYYKKYKLFSVEKALNFLSEVNAMRMKKMLLLFAVMSLSASGCVETPEEDVVIKKSKTSLMETESEKLVEGEYKNLNSDDQWQESYSLLEGKLILEVDTKVEIDNIGNTPIIQMKRHVMSDKELEKLARFFAGENLILKDKGSTEDELENWITLIEGEEGEYGSPYSKYKNAEYISNLEVLKGLAIDGGSEEEVNLTFDYSEITERQYMLIGEGEDIIVRTEQNRFTGIVDDGFDSEIHAIQDNQVAGTTSNFYYEKGMTYSALNLQLDRIVLASMDQQFPNDKWVQSANNTLDLIELNLEERTFKLDKAEQYAENILNELDITEMKLGEVYSAICYDDKNMDIWVADIEESCEGYVLEYYRDIENISAFWYNGESHEIPEESYKPPFGQEKIQIVVTESGVQSFRWQNMAEIDKVIVENTKLLDFVEIQKRLLKVLEYAVVGSSSQSQTDNLHYHYELSHVELRYAYISALDEPEKAYLVPAWVFTVTSEIEEGGSRIKKFPEKILINAIDGSYIDPNASVLDATY